MKARPFASRSEALALLDELHKLAANQVNDHAEHFNAQTGPTLKRLAKTRAGLEQAIRAIDWRGR